MTLPADAQRFLGHHYRQDAADIFDGDLHGVKQGMHGSWGRDSWCFATCPDGVGWAQPDEPHAYGYALSDWPHRVRWAAILAHVAAQPNHLREKLRNARDAYRSEEWGHRERLTAIRPGWYSGATADERALLDAECERHYAASARLRAARDAALLDLLPLATDEPADLIEWAAALA